MFNLFKSLTGGGGYLGVDIGTISIKIAELEKGLKKPVLKNYGTLEGSGHLDRINDAIQTSSLKMMDKDVIGLLELLMKQIKVRSKKANVSIPSFSSFTTLLDIPAMSPKEMTQAIYYQAKAFVPIPLQDVTIDWTVVGEYEDERGVKKQQIFLVSVPNEVIKRYQRIFGAVGLSLQALEIEGFSTARVLSRKEQGDVLIVDIGGRSTTISVASKGFLKFNAQT
ncbi:MAG TPA: pilus assembly protein PilM, partial [Candidatus Paceibacterota bacterium]